MEGKTQRSVLIELIYARDQILVYNGKRLGEAGRDISDKDVYRAFGPTYAPSARSSDCISRSTSTAMPLQLISLCYPGIVFTFEKRSTHARTEQVLSMVTVVNSSNSNVELARVTDVLANLENYNLVESGGGLASVEISASHYLMCCFFACAEDSETKAGEHLRHRACPQNIQRETGQVENGSYLDRRYSMRFGRALDA